MDKMKSVDMKSVDSAVWSSATEALQDLNEYGGF